MSNILHPDNLCSFYIVGPDLAQKCVHPDQAQCWQAKSYHKNQSIVRCFRYSVQRLHRDGSFEYPHHVLVCNHSRLPRLAIVQTVEFFFF